MEKRTDAIKVRGCEFRLRRRAWTRHRDDVRRWTAQVALLVIGSGVILTGQSRQDELQTRLAQVGRRVESYYTRARNIVCRELVRLQPLKRDLMPDGPPRELVYEMRVSWEPDALSDRPTATVFRQLLTVNGRPASPGDEPECTDPRTEAVDPLVSLLPRRRSEFVFSSAGTERLEGRNALRLDYRPVRRVRPTVTWQGDCASVDLAGQTRGRVWVDAATDEVLRLDERIDGQFEFPVLTSRAYGRPNTMVIERVDTSVRYELVTFTEPEETILLPASIDTLTVVRNAAVEWSRKTQVFSDYRRFLGSGRVIQ